MVVPNPAEKSAALRSAPVHSGGGWKIPSVFGYSNRSGDATPGTLWTNRMWASLAVPQALQARGMSTASSQPCPWGWVSKSTRAGFCLDAANTPSAPLP